MWDTMAAMVLSFMAGWGKAIKCNFTGKEAKQYSNEQRL